MGSIALAAWLLWARRLEPITTAPSSLRWVRWLAAGAAIATGIAIRRVGGGEPNALWRAVMPVARLGGIAMAIVGILLAVSDRAHRLA